MNDLYMDPHLLKPEEPLEEKYTVQDVLEMIGQEYEDARVLHRPLNGPHEGYAVLWEEVDELWDEVKSKQCSSRRMRDEAVQVAAMALAFVLEVTQ